MQKISETLYLLVDTSIKGVSLALVARQGITQRTLWSGIADGQFASAGKISKLLTEGLEASKSSLDACKVIAVSVGPGSFTGIKIGLAWCYGLFAPREQQLRWLPLSALDAAAIQLHTKDKPACLFLASTRTHGYLACSKPGSQQGNSCLYQVGQEHSPWGAIPALMPQSRVTLCGEWPMLAEYLTEQQIPWQQISIRQLMELGLAGMIAQLGAHDPAELSSIPPRPRYLRQSTAEENYKGTHRNEITIS
jgi:tRNA A37 threonylcarbamoyladenosine modification protein TsaB